MFDFPTSPEYNTVVQTPDGAYRVWDREKWKAFANTSVDTFPGLYLGAHPTAPTRMPDGTGITVGAIYYNLTTNQPYVWDGTAWDQFYAPAKTKQIALVYLATANQTVFPLTTPDLGGHTYVITPGNTEPLDVHVNGLKLPQNQPLGAGKWDLNPATSTVTFTTGLKVNDVVQIDVFADVPGSLATSNAGLAPGMLWNNGGFVCVA